MDLDCGTESCLQLRLESHVAMWNEDLVFLTKEMQKNVELSQKTEQNKGKKLPQFCPVVTPQG